MLYPPPPPSGEGEGEDPAGLRWAVLGGVLGPAASLGRARLPCRRLYRRPVSSSSRSPVLKTHF